MLTYLRLFCLCKSHANIFERFHCITHAYTWKCRLLNFRLSQTKHMQQIQIWKKMFWKAILHCVLGLYHTTRQSYWCKYNLTAMHILFGWQYLVKNIFSHSFGYKTSTWYMAWNSVNRDYALYGYEWPR